MTEDRWPIESRKQMMRDVVRMVASKTMLDLKNAPAFAQTYGVTQAEVEAEFLKYPQEDCAK